MYIRLDETWLCDSEKSFSSNFELKHLILKDFKNKFKLITFIEVFDSLNNSREFLILTAICGATDSDSKGYLSRFFKPVKQKRKESQVSVL